MIRGKLLIGAMIGFVLILTVACSGTGPQTPAPAPAPAPVPLPTPTAIPIPTAQVLRGAIAEAKQSEEHQSREEAFQFGLNILSSEKDKYKQLRGRLFTNDTLASAIRDAKDQGVGILLDHKFQVGTTVLSINIDAADDEIIKFLKDSLPKAKENKTVFEQLKKEASQFGITLMLWELDEYNQIRERLLTNNKLASALRAAAVEGVMVGLKRKFSVAVNIVYINVDATDGEIIEFLLGK